MEPPAATRGERRWFLFYAPAAFVYRMFVMVAIVAFIASQWFFIGVLLALWGTVTMLLMPLGKFLGYLGTLPRSARVRKRAVGVVTLATVVIVSLLVAIPAPFRIQTEGVLWLPEEAHVRAEVDGFVRTVLVDPGAAVQAGMALVESNDPVLAAQLRVSEARIGELQARLDQQLFRERVQAELTRQELMHELANYHHVARSTEQLVARSNVSGRLVLDRPNDLPGRYFRKGEAFGYVVQPGAPRIVRMVVSQDDVDLVRNRVQHIDARFAERDHEVYQAIMLREVPAAREELPSIALSSAGGGKIAADPPDPKGEWGIASTFQFDLALSEEVVAQNYGGRVHVRLVLRPEPLAQQWYRRIRQLFLAQFHV